MREETVKKDNVWKRLDSKFSAKNPEVWKLVKWFIVATIASAPELLVQMICLYGLTALGVTNPGILGFMENIIPANPQFEFAVVVYAYMLSTATGYAVAYVLNRKETFHADSNMALSIFLYVLMVIFTIFANGMVVGPMISGLVGKLRLPAALSEIVSKLLCMAVPALWSYPLNRFVIHRKKKAPAAE